MNPLGSDYLSVSVITHQSVYKGLNNTSEFSDGQQNIKIDLTLFNTKQIYSKL
jgi:hypothetical protein